jgi:hypothetical protein
MKPYETEQRLIKARSSPKEAQYVVYIPRFANSSGWVCVDKYKYYLPVARFCVAQGYSNTLQIDVPVSHHEGV